GRKRLSLRAFEVRLKPRSEALKGIVEFTRLRMARAICRPDVGRQLGEPRQFTPVIRVMGFFCVLTQLAQGGGGPIGAQFAVSGPARAFEVGNQYQRIEILLTAELVQRHVYVAAQIDVMLGEISRQSWPKCKPIAQCIVN